MPLRITKFEDEKEFSIERAMYRRKHAVKLFKDVCVGCDICINACPQEAIKLVPAVKKDDIGIIKKPLVTIDSEKCNFCGICDAVCPFGAIRVMLNGEHFVPVIESESFPQLIRDIEVDIDKCQVGCIDCAKACSLNLITVCPIKPTVEIRKEQCPCCKWCEVKCPPRVIKVKKIFRGSIRIYPEKCPEGCHDCFDVCPVDAIILRKDGKVEADDRFCVYCKACLNVCPKKEALEVSRIDVAHTPVKSAAWIKAFEKVASITSVSKELRAKTLVKLRENVQKIFP